MAEASKLCVLIRCLNFNCLIIISFVFYIFNIFHNSVFVSFLFVDFNGTPTSPATITPAPKILPEAEGFSSDDDLEQSLCLVDLSTSSYPDLSSSPSLATPLSLCCLKKEGMTFD
jgi:hypothetical protein